MLDVFILVLLHTLAGQVTDAELQSASEAIWAADANRFSNSDVIYDISGTRLFFLDK